jgi:hypothetical protein
MNQILLLLLIIPALVIFFGILYYIKFIRPKNQNRNFGNSRNSGNNSRNSGKSNINININLQPFDGFDDNAYINTDFKKIKTDSTYFIKKDINLRDFKDLYNDNLEKTTEQWNLDKIRRKLNSDEINYLDTRPMVNKYFTQTINALLWQMINESKNYYNILRLENDEVYLPFIKNVEYNDFLNENKYIITYTYIEKISYNGSEFYILNNNKYIISKVIIVIDKETEELESITTELYNDKCSFSYSDTVGGKSQRKKR